MANHRLLSDPPVMLMGFSEQPPQKLPVEYSVTVPDGVTLPLVMELKLTCSVNHRFPSDPSAIALGLALAVFVLYSAPIPPVVGFITPILLVPVNMNQRLWSGPTVMPSA